MIRQVVTRNGKRCVIIEERELLRLERLAARHDDEGLPTFPPADEHGNREALGFLRVSIARDLIKRRRAVGLTQDQLARVAGIRQETLCRLETGTQSPSVRTVDKIDAALRKAEAAPVAKKPVSKRRR